MMQELTMTRLYLISLSKIMRYQPSITTDINFQWQGSRAQKLLNKDIKNGVLEKYMKDKYRFPKMEYWLTRPEFYDEFPLHVFCDKI